jgi:hypothetical protein
MSVRTRVFACAANPAVDPPFYYLKKDSDAADLVTMKRARWISKHAIQLLQLHPTEQQKRESKFGNYSGGDPANWAIVGQTNPENFGPGFPHYCLINPGRAGLNP